MPRHKRNQIGAFILILFLFAPEIFSQAYPGFTLFAPFSSRYTYLIDLNNTVVRSWYHSKSGGYSCYLLPDGSVIRTASSSSSSLNGGGAQGVVQRYSWEGNLIWEYTYSTTSVRAHHDIEVMPNGNVLIIAWELKTSSQAVQAGLNHSSTIWPDHIIEVQPVGTNGGNIVWKWHTWDHLIQDYDPSKSNYGVVANHPELFDINVESAGSGDWLHINGISYNPVLDQIVFSSHELDEFYVIDHSTTTEQAAGHTGGNSGKGGDILYRWGRPANYRAPGAQVFNVVHYANWIQQGLPGAGNIMAFNNREGTNSSMIVEIKPPMDTSGQYIFVQGTAYGPSSPAWSYSAPGFYANHLGSCQRLPNGNTMIVESTTGYLFEVDSLGNEVWFYNRGGQVVRGLRYGLEYPGVSALVPVQMTSFSATIQNNFVLLNWITATEKNNFGFEIQRLSSSTSHGLDWETIGFVNGNGTSTENNSYSFKDENLGNGVYKYRLKQIDFDGTENFSKTIEVDFNTPLQFTLEQNFPNPFNPETIISFEIPEAMFVTLKIYDVLGNELSTLLNEQKEAGKHQTTFIAKENFTSGVYIYRLSASSAKGKAVQTKQMMLLK